MSRIRVENLQPLGEHTHSWATLHWICAGIYGETVESRHYECRPGMLLFEPGNIVHANAEGFAACNFVRFEIDTRLLPDALRDVRTEQQASSALIPLLARTVAEGSGALSRLAADELIQELSLDVVGARPTVRASAARRARLFIDLHFERNFSLAQLAAECGTSRETLSRGFRAHYGVTMAAYQVRLRLARAIQLRRSSCP